ncbi:hypothetical protein HUW46_02127 [Amycolatopsis sp. CA-230715]|nr:hypothetical protein HUW46_02127 [Amycolatopsis sp. CA-230715]
MDGVAVWDAELPGWVAPASCRLGHPLSAEMKTTEIDWLEYLCRRCLAEGVADPYLRLRKRTRI